MIALWGFPKGTNTILRLDNPALTTDEGAAMTSAYFVTADVDFGPAGGEGRLRRIVQRVSLGANSTVKLTPVADGAELADQAESFALLAADGAEQGIEHYVASLATRHAVRVDVTALGGTLAVGEADLFLVPRRTTANA